jgi:L-threonylcarbamoyladenylate synthase
MPGRLRIDLAARVIVGGGIVAYPTEAVYGLGCLPFDQSALERIIAIKRRDAAKGMIVVAAGTEQLETVASLPSGSVGDQIRASWPGPVTWIVPAQQHVPRLLTGGRDTIAVRVSAHPIVQRLCRRVGGAIVSTSANCSGHRPARTALQVRRMLGADLDFVLSGPLGASARPTEIRDFRTGKTIRAG